MKFSLFGPKVPTVTPIDASHATVAGQALLIDVREKEEYRAGHAVGAKNYPMSMFTPEQLVPIVKNNRVYVICQSGRRSAMVVKALCELKVDAYNVTGGTSGWQQAGLPMVASE